MIEMDPEGRVKNAPTELINAVTEHVAKSREAVKIDAPRKQLERNLKSLQNDLAEYLIVLPREKGETIAKYVQRLEVSALRIPQIDRAPFVLNWIVSIVHALRRLDEREAEKQREAQRFIEQDQQRWEQQMRDLRERATIDENRVRALRKVIRNAEEDEELLARLYQALAGHRAARDARDELRRINDDAISACARLGLPRPKTFKVPPADQRAVDMCELLSK